VSDQKKPYPLRLESVLRFGKHQGKRFQDVIDQDLEYIKYLHRKAIIGFHPHAWDYFMEKVNGLKPKAPFSSIYTRHSKRRK
jgi:hypothetical protein